ncbi:MAG: cytochrome c [Pseudomonadota bacterium]|nr:cytochrome c [Pseudomonadota bacterium]
MKNKLGILIALVAVGSGVAWGVLRASPVDEDRFAALSGNPDNGQTVFTAAGCASCHHAPAAEKDAKLVLTGGQKFPSDFGTFIAPNISSDPEHGIGGWSLTEFASAVTKGVSPDGSHYYPAFPYTSYTKMTDQDVADLWSYMQTLPASDAPSQPHEVGFPFNIRASLGGWKLLFMSDEWVVQNVSTEAETKGRYLVEALAHCGECHSPRNALGGLDRNNWLAGAPNPAGDGRIPALTPGQLDWASEDIAYYLESGFTPDFDSVGGHMVEVVDNFAKLSAEDRTAVAQYLKALPTAD